jgi:nucleotide-binding universal stress UspA family protein
MPRSSHCSILVSLNDIAALPRLLACTCQVAKLMKAEVTGLYVIPAVQVYPMMGYDAVPETFDGNQLHFRKNRDRVKADFEAAMQAAGIVGRFVEFESRHAEIAADVAASAHVHDLVVVAGPQPDAAGFEDDFAERVVMLAGRPMLVLPHTSQALDLSRIVLGWDGGREAARAAFDALPILQKADRVIVAAIDQGKGDAQSGDGIVGRLALQGIAAEVVALSSNGLTAGEMLLHAAREQGAGLLVMGAYGHSRFTEWIFGGATRHVFRHMTVPVLMSH